jgi:hypothetical protein
MGAAPRDTELLRTTLREGDMLGQGKRTIAALLTLGALAACRYRPSYFPVHGTTGDRSRLVGEWYGELTSMSTDRTGLIDFRFEPGRDSASGDVTILPRAALQQAWHQENHPHHRAAAPTALRIRLLRVDAATVEGFVEPFQDPDCGCTVATRFHGVVHGDSMTGEYVSRGGWVSREGTWRMRRRATANTSEAARRGGHSRAGRASLRHGPLTAPSLPETSEVGVEESQEARCA